MNHLPPLNALRAFEVASRHLNFTRAAEELHVTHGAVSRHVLSLEERLRTLLFVRAPRGLTLTPEGAKLARAVSAAFDMLHVAFEQLRPDGVDDALRISVPPTFALRWLIPRLGAWHRSHPQLRLEVSTSIEPVGPRSAGYDVAIRRIDRAPKGWTATRFLDGRSVPVCSPAFLERHAMRGVPDLGRVPLVAARTEAHAWQDWLRAQRQGRDGDAPTLMFEELYFALQAAIDSLGVALIPRAIVDEEVRLGRLVALAAIDAMPPRAYALLSPRLSSKRAAIEELAGWLRTVPPVDP